MVERGERLPQPFPGSVAARAFALLHILWRDGLVDYDFIPGGVG